MDMFNLEAFSLLDCHPSTCICLGATVLSNISSFNSSVCYLLQLAISKIRLQDLLQSLEFHCSSSDSLNQVLFDSKVKNDFETLFHFFF